MQFRPEIRYRSTWKIAQGQQAVSRFDSIVNSAETSNKVEGFYLFLLLYTTLVIRKHLHTNNSYTIWN